MQCPRCKFDNPSGARFCGGCGFRLGTPCPSCGVLNPEGFAFCSNCGASLTVSRPQVSVREERKIVTVLFGDVVGSTAAASARDPEDIRLIMGRFFDLMRGEIERFGGTVEKFIGDAVMAVFGLPRAHEDDPERAVRSALAMRVRLRTLNDEFRPLGLPLEMRVGINTGEVVADPQAAEKGEFLVTGDAVNVAARLQQAAAPGAILIGERTFRDLAGVVECRPQTALAVPGKHVPVRTWQVVDLLPQRRARGPEGLRAPMIGRDQELALLTAHYGKVEEDGQPYLITIVGAAGVGKTRLQEEFTAMVAQRPTRPAVFRGRCLPYGEGITYGPIAEILKSECGILDSDLRDTARAKLEAGISRWLPDSREARRIAGALGFTVGIQFPDSPLASMDPRAVREELLHAWQDFFEARAQHSPLVLVFEDIHWADESLLDLLEYLADRLSGAPILLLCLARPELLDKRPMWGGGKRNYAVIRLDPLSEEKNRRLLAELLQTDLPETLRAAILSRSEGNPFFTEEILRMLIDAGVLVKENGHWHATTPTAEFRVPDTIQGVIAARLDHLPPEEKVVLQQASVIGRIFWLDPLRRLTSLDSGHSRNVLRRLEQRELIQEGEHGPLAADQQFVFKHILVRDVAYSTLPRTRRGHPHAVVAEWLEEVAGQRIDEFAELVAYHYHQAALLTGEDAAREQARRYLILAGDVAGRKYAAASAIRYYESALQVTSHPSERMVVFERIGDAYTVQWSGGAGWEYHRRALEAWKAAGAADRVAGARLYAKLAENPTRWRGAFHTPPSEQEVLGYIEDGLALLEGLPDSVERARLHAARGLLPNYTGREIEAEIRAALTHSLEALRIMESIGSPRDRSAALDAVQGAHRQLAEYPAALEANLRRWELRAQITQRDELIDIGCMLASSYTAVGEYPEALKAAQWAVGLGEEAGLVGWHLHPLMWRTLVFFEWDRWDEANRSAEEFVRAREAYGRPYHTWVGNVLMIQAIVFARRGEFDQAVRHAHEAEAFPFRVPGTAHLPAVMLMAADELNNAAQRLETLRADHGRLQPAVHSNLAEIYATIGAPEFAEVGPAALELAKRAGARKQIAQSYHAVGIAHLREGRLDEAESRMLQSLHLYRALGTSWEIGRTLLHLGDVHRRRGAKPKATEAWDEAEGRFIDLRALRDLNRLREVRG